MSEFVRSGAKMAVGVGLFVGIGSWTADVATCPGEVERSGNHEVGVVICDENPGSDNWVNTPGTLEQKLMMGGFTVATLGGVVLALPRRRQEPIPEPVR